MPFRNLMLRGRNGKLIENRTLSPVRPFLYFNTTELSGHASMQGTRLCRFLLRFGGQVPARRHAWRITEDPMMSVTQRWRRYATLGYIPGSGWNLGMLALALMRMALPTVVRSGLPMAYGHLPPGSEERRSGASQSTTDRPERGCLPYFTAPADMMTLASTPQRPAPVVLHAGTIMVAAAPRWSPKTVQPFPRRQVEIRADFRV